VSCDRQQITALVDGALGDAAGEAVEAHVAECETCRDQLADERALRTRLRSLPAPELPFGLEQRIRARLRRGRRLSRLTRVVLPLAAALVVGLWARGYAPFVAWELSRDHQHCFSMEKLPAEVWGSESEQVADWYGEHGDHLPLLPSSVAGLSLVGGRYCPLPDVSFAPHLYYVSDEEQVSVFVLSHGVRMRDDFRRRVRGNAVALVRVGRDVVGVVGEDDRRVGDFVARLRTSIAALGQQERSAARLFRPSS
jgi:anti-sigma factor RsiW